MIKNPIMYLNKAFLLLILGFFGFLKMTKNNSPIKIESKLGSKIESKFTLPLMPSKNAKPRKTK